MSRWPSAPHTCTRSILTVIAKQGKIYEELGMDLFVAPETFSQRGKAGAAVTNDFSAPG